MLKYFRPNAGRLGIAPSFFPALLSGTIANTTTTTFNAGGPHRRAFVERLSVACKTLVASASAVTCIVYKYDASADTAVALTAAFDLKGLTADKSGQIALLTTLTDADKTFDEGDTVRVVVTAAGTISTQPADLRLVTEFAVLS